MSKIVVIGLDGATFRLIDPLVEQKKMPNLKRCIERGVKGTLLSTRPPVTVPAWTTFATGVNPGKHGCYDFFLPGRTIRDFRPATSNDIRVPTFYELLHAAGKKTILVNLPNSYPPRCADQTIITDFMTIGSEYIFPTSLKQKYPILSQYRLSPDEHMKVTRPLDEYIDHVLDLERNRVAAVKTLMHAEPWDLFFFLFSSTDWISHLQFYDMARGKGPKAMGVFQIVDEFLGWIAKTYGDDMNVYILSDHGFTYYTEIFYINRWLEHEGYLVTRQGSKNFEEPATARRRSLTQARATKKIQLTLGKKIFSALAMFPQLERAAKWIYNHLIKQLLPISVIVDIGIDLDRTRVCFPRGSMLQTLYLNFKGNFTDGLITDRAEYDRIRQDVKRKLEALHTPSGKRVTEHVFTKEELYGENPPIPSPDLHCQTKDVWIVGHLHSQRLFEKKIENKHDEFGIFIATGPDIRHDTLQNVSIADLTPTILHHMGLPISDFMDGHVLDVFRKESEPDNRAVHVEKTAKAESRILNTIIDQIEI